MKARLKLERVSHARGGFCHLCDDMMSAGSLCRSMETELLGKVDPRFEKHRDSPLPYQTPPPPLRSRRVKKPKEHRR